MTNEVNTEAKKQQASWGPKTARGLVILFALIGAYNVFFADNKKDVTATSQSAQASTNTTAVLPAAPIAPAADIAPSEPPPPSHNYALYENGEYGYQPAISEDERQHGVATKALMMFRYLGEHNGVYSVQARDGDQRITSSCAAPCEFVKMRLTINGETVSEERVTNTPGSLIGEVMEDAMSGQLEPYKATAPKL